MLLALVVTSLFMATSICGALRNYVEAMSGEDFGHNWSKFECFKVQLVTCCGLSVFFVNWRYIPHISL